MNSSSGPGIGGSRLLSINGRQLANDMDMVTAVQTMKRPLEMCFTLVKKNRIRGKM